MGNIDFLVNTLLSYSLLFVLIYIQLKYFSDNHQDNAKNSFIKRGIMLGVVAVLMMSIVSLSGLKNISDGRYAILFITVLCYDFYTAIVPFLMINTYILIFLTSNIYPSFITTLVTIVFTGVYKNWFGIRGHHYLRIIIMSVLTASVNMTFGAIFARKTSYYQTLEINVVYTVILFSGITTLIIYLIDKEFQSERTLKKLHETTEELELQNEEIKALYDNVSEAEASLKANYDTLDEYRWRLEASDKRYARVLDASCEGFFDYFPITKVWLVSNRLCDLLEYPYEESNVLARSLFDSIPLQFRNIELYFTSPSLWAKERKIAFELQVETKSGEKKWFLFSAIADIDNEKRLSRITGSFLDINQRKIEQEKVEYYAFHDPETGFLNQDYFVETVKKYFFSSNENMMILYVCLAHYDQITNLYGEKISNMVKIQLGNEITAIFGKYAVVSMMKSGAFAVLILQKDRYFDFVTESIKILNKKYTKPMRYLNMDLQVSLVFPYDEYRPKDTVEALIERLDTTRAYCEERMIYGKLTAFQWEFYNQKTFEKEIAYFLKTAILQSLFYVQYQPQYKRINHAFELCSLEALVRLEHPQYGTVSPDLFIQIAEQIGEIHKIDKIVLQEAIAYGKHVKDDYGKALPIAVNVSFIDLLNSDYVMWVVEQLENCRKEGIEIILEITETAITKYFEGVSENLKKIYHADIEIHLDDFGTGYSSLSHIAKLPISTIKIDRSFIDQMTSNPKIIELVKMMITLGKNLELNVLAEGIETEDQLRILEDLSCEYYQGYYFSKPLSPEHTDHLIESQRKINE